MLIEPTLTKLKSLDPNLRGQGVCGLHLFDQARIVRHLGEAMQAKVDLVPRWSLHPLVKARAEAERITIFG